jgi:N-acetylglucosaminyldiphosphoundecaprenol N-acetyl-beta-D-mannosaminyltransferase
LKYVKLSVAGGAVFDFISGNVSRAPVFVQKIGMEWLWRFQQEPKRLFKRYFVGNFTFLYNILFNKAGILSNKTSSIMAKG